MSLPRAPVKPAPLTRYVPVHRSMSCGAPALFMEPSANSLSASLPIWTGRHAFWAGDASKQPRTQSLTIAAQLRSKWDLDPQLMRDPAIAAGSLCGQPLAPPRRAARDCSGAPVVDEPSGSNVRAAGRRATSNVRLRMSRATARPDTDWSLRVQRGCSRTNRSWPARVARTLERGSIAVAAQCRVSASRRSDSTVISACAAQAGGREVLDLVVRPERFELPNPSCVDWPPIACKVMYLRQIVESCVQIFRRVSGP